MQTMVTGRVGERNTSEMDALLKEGYKFSFTATDSNMDRLIYEVFVYSDEQDMALFISTDSTIIYEVVYSNLEALRKAEPIDLSKFVIVLV